MKREIDSKRDTFDSLADCYSQLVRLVGADDANELDAQVRNLSARYDELGRRCVQCGHALHGFSEDMSSFLADTDEVSGRLWELLKVCFLAGRMARSN